MRILVGPGEDRKLHSVTGYVLNEIGDDAVRRHNVQPIPFPFRGFPIATGKNLGRANHQKRCEQHKHSRTCPCAGSGTGIDIDSHCYLLFCHTRSISLYYFRKVHVPPVLRQASVKNLQ